MCPKGSALETVEDNIVREAYLLVHQKVFHVRSLVSAELNDLPNLLVLLDGAVAAEVLLEGLADALDVEVVGKAGHRCDTLAPVALLDADVNLVFRRNAPLVSRVLERVCEKKGTKQERKRKETKREACIAWPDMHDARK